MEAKMNHDRVLTFLPYLIEKHLEISKTFIQVGDDLLYRLGYFRSYECRVPGVGLEQPKGDKWMIERYTKR